MKAKGVTCEHMNMCNMKHVNHFAIFQNSFHEMTTPVGFDPPQLKFPCKTMICKTNFTNDDGLLVSPLSIKLSPTNNSPPWSGDEIDIVNTFISASAAKYNPNKLPNAWKMIIFSVSLTE